MLVTIDTNILYQSLYSSSGASYALLEMIREGEIRMALSHQVLLEYEEVLTRVTSLKSFGLSLNDVRKVLRFIAYISEKFEPKFLFRPNLLDENDNIFIELAVVSQSSFIITKNLKDFRNSELKFECSKLLNPSEFLTLWRK